MQGKSERERSERREYLTEEEDKYSQKSDGFMKKRQMNGHERGKRGHGERRDKQRSGEKWMEEKQGDKKID